MRKFKCFKIAGMFPHAQLGKVLSQMYFLNKILRLPQIQLTIRATVSVICIHTAKLSEFIKFVAKKTTGVIYTHSA